MQWRESDHPRAPDGQFTEVAGWVKKLDDKIAGRREVTPGVTETRMSVAELSKMDNTAPGRFDEQRVASLVDDMKANGFRGFVSVEETNRGPLFTDGNARLEAARRLGMADVPVRQYANTPEGRRAANKAMADDEAAKAEREALAGPDWYEYFAQSKRNEHPGLQLELYRTGGGHLVLANIRVPQKQQGVGTKIMTEITELADRNGDTVALTPASDYGSNKTRLKQFYKRFGFVENKGRNRDYGISDDMYREPRKV